MLPQRAVDVFWLLHVEGGWSVDRIIDDLARRGVTVAPDVIADAIDLRERDVTGTPDYLEYWLNVRLGERVVEVAESFLKDPR